MSIRWSWSCCLLVTASLDLKPHFFYIKFLTRGVAWKQEAESKYSSDRHVLSCWIHEGSKYSLSTAFRAIVPDRPLSAFVANRIQTAFHPVLPSHAKRFLLCLYGMYDPNNHIYTAMHRKVFQLSTIRPPVPLVTHPTRETSKNVHTELGQYVCEVLCYKTKLY